MQTKTIIIFSAICALSSLGSAYAKDQPRTSTKRLKPNVAIDFDFKGARLGMTLAEWRALPIDVMDDGGSAFEHEHMPEYKVSKTTTVCKNDSQNMDEAPDLFFGDAPDVADVTVCTFAHKEGTLVDIWKVSNVKLADGAADSADYYFSNGRLYEIVVRAPASLADDVTALLRQKYGSSSTVRHGTVQNSFGALFEQTNITWDRSDSYIDLTSPFNDLNHMSLQFGIVSVINGIERKGRATRLQHGKI